MKTSCNVEMHKLLSGRELRPLTAAKAYFSGLRESTPIGSLLSDLERSDALDVYQRYCAMTGASPVAAVSVTVISEGKLRPGGNYMRNTRSFAVVSAAGEAAAFNREKALQAIVESPEPDASEPVLIALR